MDGARAERSPILSKGTKDWRALRGRGWGLESDVAQPACRWEWALSTPTSCRGGPAAGAEGGGAGARSHSHPSALPHFHHPAALSARLQPPAGFGCTIKLCGQSGACTIISSMCCNIEKENIPWLDYARPSYKRAVDSTNRCFVIFQEFYI